MEKTAGKFNILSRMATPSKGGLVPSDAADRLYDRLREARKRKKSMPAPGMVIEEQEPQEGFGRRVLRYGVNGGLIGAGAGAGLGTFDNLPYVPHAFDDPGYFVPKILGRIGKETVGGAVLGGLLGSGIGAVKGLLMRPPEKKEVIKAAAEEGLTARESFKVAFLQALAEAGTSPREAVPEMRKAAALADDVQKDVTIKEASILETVLSPGRWMIDKAVDVGKTMTPYAAAAAFSAPIAVGLTGGYLAAKARDDDTSIEAAKAQEEIAQYERLTADAQRRAAIKRKKLLPLPSGR